MTTDPTYPYTLDVSPCTKPEGHFQWAIRKHGKLIQRSDRSFRSEDDARKDGEKVIEREFSDGTRRER